MAFLSPSEGEVHCIDPTNRAPKQKPPRPGGGGGGNARALALFGEYEFRGVRFHAGRGIRMKDAAAHGFVTRGDIGDGGALGGRRIGGLRGGLQLSGQRLEAGLHRLVAQHAPGGFAGVLDGGFCVGHDELKMGKGVQTQTPQGESRSNSLRCRGRQAMVLGP